MIEDAKGVIESRKSKNYRQKKTDKILKKNKNKTNNDLQNPTKQKPDMNSYSERVSNSCSTSGTRHVTLVTPVVSCNLFKNTLVQFFVLSYSITNVVNDDLPTRKSALYLFHLMLGRRKLVTYIMIYK